MGATGFARRSWRWRLLSGLLLGGTAGADGSLGAADAGLAWESLDTHFGHLRVCEFGPPDGPLVVLVHGRTDSKAVREEWAPVAQRLAKRGFHALLPDFHSGPPQLQPGALTGEVFRRLLSDTLLRRNQMVPLRYQTVVRPKALVMGKSWGAQMAAEAGALENVVGAALVVPPLDEGTAAKLLPRIGGHVAVLLVRDDPIVNFDSASAAIRSALAGREVTWVEAESGGHLLLQEFVDPLLEFAEAARPSFIHSSPEEL